ncbi:hypothetical protein QBC36DRAFT_335062 [Triangularia setosa]|uniref:Uncharacterized protein n=1 Tax=Triangularia setosa TaxID=2587417 RepID=A0AAN6W2N0_9PEZI|nr:hypothetical protein QBC36DRAFT_335062 [Podospora setosa]
MNSNQPDPVMGVANPNMSFFRKHTPFRSLSGNRAPLNSIAVTPFLQTLFTIPTVVSPSPQTAGLDLDGEDKIDSISPAAISPETPASSAPSVTADAADDERKISDTDAAESNAPPIQDHAEELVLDSAWIDESLNAPVSPNSILALPNRLTGVDPVVVEDAVPLQECDIAPIAAIASPAPASNTLELPFVDPTWMDIGLLAPVTPTALLALPDKVPGSEINILEETPVAPVEIQAERAADAVEHDTEASASAAAVPVDAPGPEQPTTSPEQTTTETPLAPAILIPDSAWIDEFLNAPVTPYALLSLPEKNITAASSSALDPPPSLLIEAVQTPATSTQTMPISDAWTDASFDAPVTPLVLLALPEKNCTSTASLVSEPPLIASIIIEETQTSSPLAQTTPVDNEDRGCELTSEPSASTIVTEFSPPTDLPSSKLGAFEDKAWEDDFVASGNPLDPAYDSLLHDVTFLVPVDTKSEQEELRKLTGKTRWEARRLAYAAQGLRLKDTFA